MKPSINTIETRLSETLKKEYTDIKPVARQIRAAMDNADSYKSVDNALDTINMLLHGYGVESIRDNQFKGYYCDIGILYVNMGDTYCSTVAYDTRSGNWIVASWGDIVERDMKRFDV